MRLGDLDELKSEFDIIANNSATNEWQTLTINHIKQIIDNAPTVEPEKVLVANVTFDEDKLKEIVQTEVIEKIKSGDLVISSDERPQGEWIPVSEKLPKDRDWYLGVFRDPDTGYIIDLPFVCDYVGYPNEGTTNDAWILRGLTDIDNPSKYYKNLECVAWQALPEPYKKGGKEE